MSTNKVSVKYARALCMMAEEKDLLTELGEKLQALKKLVEENPPIFKILKNPSLAAHVKESFFAELLKQESDLYIRNFMQLLCRKHRENLFFDIVEEFLKMANEVMGILTIQVKTATLLKDEEYLSLGKKIKDLKGLNQVRVEMIEDPSLLGGLLVNVDGMLIDATVKRRIEKLTAAISN